MEILKNISLRPYNTFGMDVNASFFAIIDKPMQLQEIHKPFYSRTLPILFLGGGSNILLTKDFDGLVLKICFRGINYEYLNDRQVLVRAGAGENWDDLVQYCVNKGWGGLENLSFIPGSVGASPIQNIGAYGAELKDVFSHLEAMDLQTFEFRRFTLPECKFGYRNSIFKNKLKNCYLITSVSFLLSSKPEINLSYPVLINELQKIRQEPTVRSVADAVVRIRKSKLPDPKQLGNAGSFFKNPVIGNLSYERLKADYPGIPSFLQQNGLLKMPAAWLIEQCGWKGRRFGDAGVHAFQPLVLVNYGNASGSQILDLSERIKESVFNRFNIHLEPEVNIL